MAESRGVQPEDPAGAARGADAVEHPLVPALEWHLVGQPAEDLVGQDDRGDDRAAVGAARFGGGEHGGDHVARMAGAPRRVGVVAVEVADERGVGEGGHVDRRPLPGAEQARGRLALCTERRPPRDDRGLAVEGADPTAQRVDQRALGLVDRLWREIRVAQPERVAAQVFCRGVHDPSRWIV